MTYVLIEENKQTLKKNFVEKKNNLSLSQQGLFDKTIVSLTELEGLFFLSALFD